MGMDALGTCCQLSDGHFAIGADAAAFDWEFAAPVCSASSWLILPGLVHTGIGMEFELCFVDWGVCCCC